MLPTFTLLSRFLISASRNVRFSIQPGSYRSFLSSQYRCCCSHSSLYQQTSYDALQKRLEKLNVSTIQSRAKSSRKRRVCFKFSSPPQSSINNYHYRFVISIFSRQNMKVSQIQTKRFNKLLARKLFKFNANLYDVMGF